MSVSTGVACNKKTKLRVEPAGKCSFCDSPLTLLYSISGSMDIESKRNLLMVSPYLYSKWSLDLSQQDHNWGTLSSCIQLLAQTAAAAESCDTDRTSIKAYLADQSTAQISCLQQHNLFVVVVFQKRMSNSRRHPQIVWAGLTLQLLWRRLAASPGLLSTSMTLASKPAIDWYKLKELAQKLFSLLFESEGFLLFYLPSVSTDNLFQSSLLITHFYNSWTIDHQKCTVFTPELNFDMMPQDVISIEARVFSAGTEQAVLLRSTYSACQCAQFAPDHKHKANFAYNSNVDVDAWAAQQTARLDAEIDISQEYDDFT
ncbi:hypothetical protein WJX77_004488 [Trebouxia sp. C0004]